jgi:hypothetical protein
MPLSCVTVTEQDQPPHRRNVPRPAASAAPLVSFANKMQASARMDATSSFVALACSGLTAGHRLFRMVHGLDDVVMMRNNQPERRLADLQLVVLIEFLKKQ